ncbi:fibronectin type III domain-containing protein [Micromonospora sp. AP08]|uniref:choice-of-anchor L domain-containing protein n=1 Tax=Micromonospora sp. AP08 TaxID=2604467 RepID=UPI0011DC0F46|nr:choice-of-anchor L domain-containing protein [Micromonospora sp. AP08]TYB40220.1 fibronectin type III domain-containing protein [Micromonospora sp. AP08]
MGIKRIRLAVAAFAATATIAALFLNSGTALAASGAGAVKVTINAPEGVPATIFLDGKTQLVAAKPPASTTATLTLSMPAGAYHVNLPAIEFGGARYVGQSSRPEAVVRPGATTPLTVIYEWEGGPRDLHVTSLDRTTVALRWTAADSWRFALRRAVGPTAPRKVDEGAFVPTDGTSATDSGLAPGAQYSYSLFAKDHSRWYGPLVISVTTASPAGSTNASYVTQPSTFIANADDIASAATTGDGVRIVLNEGVRTPLLGAAVVLPVSPALPGGYLGVVSGVSSNGRALDLVAGGLSDAFDYYELSVDSFTTDADILASPTTAPSAAAPSAKSSGTAMKKPATRTKAGKGSAASKSVAGAAAPMTADVPPAPSVSAGLCHISVGTKVEYAPSIALAGHFKTKLDKYRFLGVDIPTGASLDMALTAKVIGAASIDVGAKYDCVLPLPKVFKTLTVNPVPLSVMLEPTVRFTVSGALKVSNIGATVTGGVHVAGSMTVKDGASFFGSAILDASPLTPLVSLNGAVDLEAGGALTVGPGVGTANAGVIAGVKGQIYPLDASYKAHFPLGDPNYNNCSHLKASLSAGLSLTAKAWLNSWSWSQNITLDALNGELPYPGSPWEFPKGCSIPTGTPDSLLGPGVSKVSDSTSGSADQWGHVDGFVPGKKAWVLSTGRISDAVGTPDQFASTELGLPGDADLSALAGYATHDAASYQVTLVPSAPTLHVRYVFASEEYPEYVGSQFNDVMAVYVNGKNCSFVPGTTTPVSINTINAGENSTYYVDNSTGAAGYSTSMDGLTVPLTCSVPVAPGVPVTVRIAVADTSDGIYDSAVALVDGGIWTD